jgi:two-component system response regulator AtoC
MARQFQRTGEHGREGADRQRGRFAHRAALFAQPIRSFAWTGATSVEAEGSGTSTSLTRAVEELEARMIDAALSRTEGNKARAAALLDISERTLWYKLKKLTPEQP